MTDAEQEAHEDFVLKKPYLAQVEAGIRWWEQMRLLYNGVLFFSGLLLVMSQGGTMILFFPVFWIGAFVFGFFANMGYFLGPVIDAYVYIFSRGTIRFASMRLPLWIVGTMFSILIEILITTSYFYTGFDLD